MQPNELHPRVLNQGVTPIDATWHHHLYAPFWRLYHHNDNGARLSLQSPQSPKRRTYHLDGPGWWLIPAWTPFISDCDKNVEQYHIHFHLPQCNQAWCQRWCSQPLAVRDSAASLLDACYVLAQSISSFAADQINTAMIHIAYAHLLQSLPPQAALKTDTLQQRLQPAQMKLIHALRNPPSVAELAATCGYSIDHFSRLVRQRYGCTARRWIEQQRISLIAAELAHTTTSIDQLATEFGYSDRFHFSKAFRRVMNESPATWRQRQHQMQGIKSR